MSFDIENNPVLNFLACLNPFGTGQCLSTNDEEVIKTELRGLNPFGTGQCLSTIINLQCWYYYPVSIPLEQGNVFRLKIIYLYNPP